MYLALASEMKKERFTTDHIWAMLQDFEDGTSVAEISSRHGISEEDFFAWQRHYKGMDAQMMKRLQALEEENRRLKAINRELDKDLKLAKEVIGKKL